MHVLMVGAGLSGAVTGRALAEAGHRITVVEGRAHVAGNCHTERDAETGVMVHVYGPHIFHTDDAEVWDYVNRFATFLPYRNRVKTTSRGAVYSLPVNLHTINQFYGKTLRPDEARAFIETLADTSISDPGPSRNRRCASSAAISTRPSSRVTRKSSGAARPPNCPPRSSGACRCASTTTTTISSTASRACRGTATPRWSNASSTIRGSRSVSPPGSRAARRRIDHVFHSGPLDGWFDCDLGRLGYRTLDFRALFPTGATIRAAP